jgi:hypothetical protein
MTDLSCLRCLWEGLADFTKVLTPIASFILALVAFRLSRRVSLKEKVKEKQFELINLLINELSKQQISFDHNVDATQHASHTLYIHHFMAQNFKEAFPEFFGKAKFIVEVNPSEQFQSFLKYRGNPYMPKEIFDLLGKFWMKPIEKVEIDNSTDYILLPDMRRTEPGNPTYVTVKEFGTFEEFYAFIRELLFAINTWLGKHEAGEIGFRSDFKINT